jgi:phage anti-repressor protein
MQMQSNSRQFQLCNVNSEIQSQILTEIRSTFTSEEQTLYINSLMMYMNYHQTEDYVVDLSKVYEMIGFNEKGKAKRTLEKNFAENLDYKIIQEGQEENKACPYGQALNPEANRVRGCAGKNKEIILLNIDTFKNLCMIAKTEKAKELRRYFVKIESVVHSVISKQVVAPLEITFTPEQIKVF